MPARANGMSAGTASQLIPGVRRTNGGSRGTSAVLPGLQSSLADGHRIRTCPRAPRVLLPSRTPVTALGLHAAIGSRRVGTVSRGVLRIVRMNVRFLSSWACHTLDRRLRRA